MEIIKCKAKAAGNRQWIYGYPVKYPDGYMTLFSLDSPESFEIIPSTLCYSTGEKDKHGRELYIGDTINDFGGGVTQVDTEHPSYHASQAFPPMKRVGDTTRLGNIIFVDGTVRIEAIEMSYAYNLSNGSRFCDMEYMSNVWDQVYP